jgi:predicted CoA-binding protein
MSKVIIDDNEIAKLLSTTKRVAIVGISDKQDRPSNGVSRWLLAHSHLDLYFVNPALNTVLGKPCYPTLRDIPVDIDMVDIFRKVSDIPAVVDEAIEIIAKTDPDLVLLDIEMPYKNGFDLLNEVPKRNFDVIFTTAYNNYAIQAIKFSGFYGLIAILHFLVLFLWNDYLGLDFTFGFLIATALQLPISYLANKFIVFKNEN